MSCAFYSAWLIAWPRTFLIYKKRRIKMTDKEYIDAVARAAQITRILTLKMDEDAQDLLEEYGNILEKIIKAELIG